MARSHHIQSLGVFSSGGDSQGMNAAVRAVVRTALNAGLDVYAIYEGYEGMVRGGDYIRKLGWDDVGGILHQGGTVIGSARSAAFRTFEGRLEAAYNLITRNIDGLVCHRRRRQPDRRQHVPPGMAGAAAYAGGQRPHQRRRWPTRIPTWPSSAWSAPSTTTCSAPT